MSLAIRHKFGRYIIFAVILMGTSLAAPAPSSVAAEGGGLTDYDQQALYAVKLGKSYVEWPTVTMAGDIKIVNICVLGDSPSFLKSLSKFQAAVAAKLKINIGTVEEGQDFSTCNILYIPKNKADFKPVLAALKNLPVLTLSPIGGFASGGGMIELAVKEVSASGAPVGTKATVSLIINNKAASNSSIKIAPELLESAAEVLR